jgi:predicted MFS family arabinose efflux permease
MKERELEQSATSRLVVWSIVALMVVFLATGIWYVYLRPFFGQIAKG